MNQTRPNDRRQRGFTLVEIMVVVVIIGMLAALVAPAVLGRQAEAQIDAAKADIANIHSTVALYMQRNRMQIPTVEDLLTEDANGQPWLQGGNVENGEFLDPWGNPYQILPIEGLKYDVVSFGPDGEEDTEDDLGYLRDDY